MAGKAKAASSLFDHSKSDELAIIEVIETEPNGSSGLGVYKFEDHWGRAEQGPSDGSSRRDGDTLTQITRNKDAKVRGNYRLFEQRGRIV